MWVAEAETVFKPLKSILKTMTFAVKRLHYKSKARKCGHSSNFSLQSQKWAP